MKSMVCVGGSMASCSTIHLTNHALPTCVFIVYAEKIVMDVIHGLKSIPRIGESLHASLCT